MREVVIVSAARTPIGSFGGSLKGIPTRKLGAIAIKAAVERAGIKPEMVEEVIMGAVLQGGLGQNVARQMTLDAGLPIEVPAMTINKVCGSGLRAVELAAQIIKAGDADIVVAGGAENMSATAYAMPAARWGARMNNAQMVDMMVNDGLWDAFNGYHMGITAENVAEQWGITREELDEFSVISQNRAEEAIKAGKFKDEIVPITYSTRKGEVVFDTDEHPRQTSMEKLAKLRPAFTKDGTVTAGNASGINDGASFTIIASEDAVKKYNLKPICEVVGFGQGGVDPRVMGLGPTPAILNALKYADLKIEDMELVELNEAFAAQSLGVIHELEEATGMDREEFLKKTNVNGGAIALGHPVGASGNRILVTLIHEMQKRNLTTGLASLCIGGGQGAAVIIKMCK